MDRYLRGVLVSLGERDPLHLVTADPAESGIVREMRTVCGIMLASIIKRGGAGGGLIWLSSGETTCPECMTEAGV